MPVWILAFPLPSRFKVIFICVSLVFRVICAMRSIFLYSPLSGPFNSSDIELLRALHSLNY